MDEGGKCSLLPFFTWSRGAFVTHHQSRRSLLKHLIISYIFDIMVSCHCLQVSSSSSSSRTLPESVSLAPLNWLPQRWYFEVVVSSVGCHKAIPIEWDYKATHLTWVRAVLAGQKKCWEGLSCGHHRQEKTRSWWLDHINYYIVDNNPGDAKTTYNDHQYSLFFHLPHEMEMIY